MLLPARVGHLGAWQAYPADFPNMTFFLRQFKQNFEVSISFPETVKLISNKVLLLLEPWVYSEAFLCLWSYFVL